MEFDEFIYKEGIEYKITENKKIKILNDLKYKIKESKNYLKAINKIDFKHWRKNIDVEQLIKIVDRYKSIKMRDRPIEKFVISYYGNPYVTLNMCIQAFIYKKIIILETGEFMMGTNFSIVNIVNSVLEENRFPKLLINVKYIKNKEEIIRNNIKVLNIGAESKKWEYGENVKYIPYNNYLVYCENEKLDEFKKTIYKYACANFFEMEFMYEENIEEAIKIMNLQKDYISLIITKDKNTEEIAREKIKTRRLYINKNPFSIEEFNIDTECLR